MSIPKELNYSLKKEISAPSQPDVIRFRSDNSSYNNGDVIRIEIPTGRTGSHLFPHNSYLEGSVTINATTLDTPAVNTACNTYIDQSCYALFRRMRIIHGGSTQEDWLHFNREATAIYDLQKNVTERTGDSIHMLVDEAGLTGATFTITKATAANTASTQNSNTLSFCFSLPSALIGTLAQKALPLGLMGASSIYLELELEDARVAFIPTANITAINSFTVSNIYFNAKIVNLPADIELSLVNSTGGKILLPANTYRSELKTITAGASAFNDKFSFQYSSVKNFSFFLQSSVSANGTGANGLSARSISSRPFCNLADFYLTFNGQRFPSEAISGSSRMYLELLRSWDSMNHTDSGGILNLTRYTSGTGAVAEEVIGNTYRFLGSCDLDRFNHSSHILVSGTNTIGSSVNLVLNFSAPTAVGLNLYAFTMIDVIYEIENGLLKVET